MSDDAIQSVLQQMRILAGQAAGPRGRDEPAGQAGFETLLERSLAEVNARQQRASALAEAYEQGSEQVSLTEVMIAMQKSSIAFQATLQVRNKLLAAYQEIMSMQI